MRTTLIGGLIGLIFSIIVLGTIELRHQRMKDHLYTLHTKPPHLISVPVQMAKECMNDEDAADFYSRCSSLFALANIEFQ